MKLAFDLQEGLSASQTCLHYTDIKGDRLPTAWAYCLTTDNHAADGSIGDAASGLYCTASVFYGICCDILGSRVIQTGRPPVTVEHVFNNLL